MTARNHKKSYSSVYRIYRRLRFVRYRKRTKKLAEQKQRFEKEREQEEIRRKLLEFRKSEREQRRLKKKADKEEAKWIKEELRKEFSERKVLARAEWDILSMEDQEKLKKQKAVERQERLNQLKIEKARRKQHIKESIRSLNIRTLRQNIIAFRESAPKRKLFLIITTNSTVLFLLSYLALFLLYKAVTTISGSFFNYPMIVYYWEIYFNISPEAWYHDSVRTIFSSGPLVLFIVGVISLIIYSNIREMTGNFKLFFLWSYLQGINMLFGALLIGTLFETGVGHVISWMYIMDTGKLMYSTVSIFILVIAGLIATKSFLISGNAYFNEITRENRGFLIRSQLVLPYFLGNIILILLRQPRFMFYETFTSIILIISLLPIMIGHGSFHDLFFDEDKKRPAFRWFALLFLMVIIIIYRGILQFGIRIGG